MEAAAGAASVLSKALLESPTGLGWHAGVKNSVSKNSDVMRVRILSVLLFAMWAAVLLGLAACIWTAEIFQKIILAFRRAGDILFGR